MKKPTVIQSNLSKSRVTLVLSVFAKLWGKHFDGKTNEKHQTLDIAILCVLCGVDLVISR
jgi:hypothetical protein